MMLNEVSKKDRKNLNLLAMTPVGIFDLSDGDSNCVLNLDNKYLYKRFVTKERMHTEIAGMLLFNLLIKQDMPLLIKSGNDAFISEFMPNSRSAYDLINSGQLSVNEINVKIAAFVSRAYWEYKYFDRSKIKLFTNVSWLAKINQIIEDFENSVAKITKLGDGVIASKILGKLESARNDTAINDTKNLTVTHRDLHLDNILIGRDKGYNKFYVIDFEHTIEAPLEMEFQNSLFWNDEKSLQVENIVKIMRDEYRVNYSKEREEKLSVLYIADQVNMAITLGDNNKVSFILNKYAKRNTNAI